MPNKRFHLTKPLVTPLACARAAPISFAGEAQRYKHKNLGRLRAVLRARYVAILFVVLLSFFVVWLRWEIGGTSEVVDIDYGAGMRIDAPCKVVKIGRYLDGGSIGGILEDAKGREVPFWWDGGMRVETPEALAAPRLVYIGSNDPDEEGKYPVPVGSQGELDLIRALSGWVDSVIPPDDQEKMYSTYFDYTMRSEDRMKLLPDFNEEKRRALLTLRVVRALGAQRAEYSR